MSSEKTGVVIHCERIGDEYQITLDDVTSTNSENWSKRVLFTSTSYSKEDFENSTFTEKQFADLGLAVLIRLSALNGENGDKDA
jgi:hypothetical protein